MRGLGLIGVMGCCSLALSSCTYVTPHFTTMGYNPAAMEVVGPAAGSAANHYILGMGPTGGDERLAVLAVERAVQSAKADALVNITADHSTRVQLFGLYIRKSIAVSGTAVRFKR